MGWAEGHDVVEELQPDPALAGVGGVDVGIGGEWVGEDVGGREEFVHPLAAVSDGHNPSDDLSADDEGDQLLLLRAPHVLAVPSVEWTIAVGHMEIPPTIIRRAPRSRGSATQQSSMRGLYTTIETPGQL